MSNVLGPDRACLRHNLAFRDVNDEAGLAILHKQHDTFRPQTTQLRPLLPGEGQAIFDRQFNAVSPSLTRSTLGRPRHALVNTVRSGRI